MLSTLHMHSMQYRVSIATLKWTLAETEVCPTNQAVHLGIIRSEKENEINIEDCTSLARRTMYALMNTGLHGFNGINPSAEIKMYDSYVIPKLLYGVDILSLNCTVKQISYCQLTKTSSVTSNWNCYWNCIPTSRSYAN